MKVVRRFLTAASYVTWLPLARRLGVGDGLGLDRAKDPPPASSATPSATSLAAPIDSLTAPIDSLTAPIDSLTAPIDSLTAPDVSSSGTPTADSVATPSASSVATPNVNSSDNSKSKLESDLAGLAKYLPSVGLLIGAFLLALALACLLFFKASNIVTGAILVVAWLCATGGLHFDGLMDSADGVFSHRSKERMLEIMQDPHVGNFGVMTGISVFVLKLTALASLCEHPSLLFPALVLAPAWARWSELYAIAMFP
jgi:hypothetical protein